MKITVEFESIDEFDAFKASGKKTRTKKEEAEDAAPTEAKPAAVGFTAPATSMQGFPAATPAQAHPLVAAIIAKADGAIASGQTADAISAWFRTQIGPDAAQATWDQIKQVFIPRMSEAQLKAIAPQLGITG